MEELRDKLIILAKLTCVAFPFAGILFLLRWATL